MGGCCCSREDRAKIVHLLAGTTEEDLINLNKNYQKEPPKLNT